MEIFPHSDNQIMFSFMCSLLNSVFKIFTMLLLKKENERYRRHLDLQKKRLMFTKTDKFTLAILNALSKRAISHLDIVKPETLINWQHRFINNFWAYKHKPLEHKVSDQNSIDTMRRKDVLFKKLIEAVTPLNHEESKGAL